MSTPLVDVVIPVHDARRPLERCLRSLLKQGLPVGDQLAITVVCHNVSVESIRNSLSEDTSRVTRFLEFADGVGSPAGPKNHGVGLTSGRYLSFVDSDDFLEEGAIRAWLEFAEQEDLAAVISAERHSSGRKVRTPPVRPGRRAPLDAVRDRLAYRTAARGLFRRSALLRTGADFSEGFATGEDQLFTATMWFSGERIGYGRGLPSYVVGDDAVGRVTGLARSLEEELSAVDNLIDSEWFRSRSIEERNSLVRKLVRVQVFSASLIRSRDSSWTLADRRYVSELLLRLEQSAPNFVRALSIADQRLLDVLGDPAQPDSLVARLSVARRRFASPLALICQDIRGQLSVDGPPRFMAASAFL